MKPFLIAVTLALSIVAGIAIGTYFTGNRFNLIVETDNYNRGYKTGWDAGYQYLYNICNSIVDGMPGNCQDEFWLSRDRQLDEFVNTVIDE